MELNEIRSMPTVIEEIPDGSKGVHESCLRAFNILRKVEYFLQEGMSNKLILEMINEMNVPTDLSKYTPVNKYDQREKSGKP